jgi:hypothetical protein
MKNVESQSVEEKKLPLAIPYIHFSRKKVFK